MITPSFFGMLKMTHGEFHTIVTIQVYAARLMFDEVTKAAFETE